MNPGLPAAGVCGCDHCSILSLSDRDESVEGLPLEASAHPETAHFSESGMSYRVLETLTVSVLLRSKKDAKGCGHKRHKGHQEGLF